MSAKGRRHINNIARSALRRQSKEPCFPGTDNAIKDRSLRWDIIEKREQQERRIAKKRTQRRNFRALSPTEKHIHREAGRNHKSGAEIILTTRGPV